ncbi:hypothetical protein ACQ4M4_25475 [Leptolyngbya sp. AN02str]|uniref:hypothetical protein n=1 Tax=Leptolyngbya sp. AN02str TaxID=3423363 RepID=UPI003D320DDB
MRRAIRYSPSPDELRPSIAPHLITPKTRELNEVEFAAATERIKRQQRGIKLAIAESELEKERITLTQKRVEIGIAKLNLDATKCDFLAAAHKLVEKRARTAIAHDNAQSAISEWSLNQDAIREKVQSIHLSVQEASHKNQDKENDLRLRGMAPRFSLRC